MHERAQMGMAAHTSIAWDVVVAALGSDEPEHETKRAEVRLCANNRGETGITAKPSVREL
jgi:hypothetical protein